MGCHKEPIAIIGLATRFPQDATNTEELWKFLLAARSAHAKFPEDRIGAGHYHPDPEHGGSFAVAGGHFLSEDPAHFDAPFFNVTKGEVIALDPQQRLVLENVYHSLENAGLAIDTVTGSNTSVFVSGFNHDHLANLNTDPESKMKYKPTGTTNSLLSNRVSWFFDFKAPSVTLDTACSSSMVALHLGCQSLATGESDMSVISGVTMISFPTDIMSMGHHGFLSPKGRCFSFDHRADGYARGEGVGSLVVKRLSDAVRDGNIVRAIIRGTGVNQDGRTPGIAMPSSSAQESLMRKVYTSAGLDFQKTMMVEAHGTGTAAGDPTEANAIAKTFASRKSSIPMFVGAIKSGIGHLEGGAGIAGIIKGVLILESGIIPPNVNFEKVNPAIPLKKWNLQFPLKSVPWPSPGLRRISINSFGVGGTNAHTILDDAQSYFLDHGIDGRHITASNVPKQQHIDAIVAELQLEYVKRGTGSTVAPNESAPSENIVVNGVRANQYTKPIPRIVVLTSFDEAGIQRCGEKQAEYLQTMEPPHGSQETHFLDDFAYTMATRSQFPWKSFALASNFPELVRSLTASMPPIRSRNPPEIAFAFTGQGAQWFAMGRELLCYPVYSRSINQATDYMRSIGASWSLMGELQRSESESLINEPRLAHPACTALQIGLVDLLDSWGIKPSRVIGHSSGEIAAAYCTGKLTRKAAWKVAYFRGFVCDRQLATKGAMMAVGLSQADIEPYLTRVNESSAGELMIACFNSPKSLTMSGDEPKIDSLKQMLDVDQIFARKLKVTTAYHSSRMKEVADEYLFLMGNLSDLSEASTGSVKMFSTLTGELIEDNHLGAQYWVDNLVSPVKFEHALKSMCFSSDAKGQASMQLNATGAGSLFCDVVVEIGPHTTLQGLVKDTLATTPYASAFTRLATLDRKCHDLSTLLSTAGQLYARGAPVSVIAVNQSSQVPVDGANSIRDPRYLVNLPGYAFNHSERLIYESRLSRNYRLRKAPRHDLFGAPVPDWNAETPRWRHVLRIEEQPWLRDHLVTNQIVLPGVAYVIAAVEAVKQLQIVSQDSKLKGFRLRDISLKRALIVPDNKDGVETMLIMSRLDESSLQASSVWRKFTFSSYNPAEDGWLEHCTGYIAVDFEAAENPIDLGKEAREEAAVWKRTMRQVSERCVVPIDTSDLYDNLVTTGLAFGPLFKNTSELKGTNSREGEVLGTITVPDVATAMPMHFTHPHIIHPATMDSFMHLFLSSVLDATGKKILPRPMVPTFIQDIWMSASLDSEPGAQFRGHGKSTLLAYDKYEGHIKIWDRVTNEARVSISGIRAMPLEAVDNGQSAVRKLNHEVRWTPYIDLLEQSAFSNIPLTSDHENEEYKLWIKKLQITTLLLVTDAMNELGGKAPTGMEGHLQRYFEWMQHVLKQLDEDQVSGVRVSEFEEYRDNSFSKECLFEEVANHNADGTLALRMGMNIAKILRGEEDPLRLMFGMDDLLDRVYAQVAHLGDLPALQAAYVNMVSENSTNLRILEVGAGTGGSTAGVLESLTRSEADGSLSSNISTYSFTDISSAFFEKAKEKFKTCWDFMDFRVLDIEKNPVEQGFELGSYDMVIAQNAVHATRSLQKTLKNIRRLLKPGGKLLLQEGVRQDFYWSGIAFGLLPGWWAGYEPERLMSPWISSEQWDLVIRASRFSGTDLELRDRSSTDLHTQSLFISTAIEDVERPQTWPKTAIVTTTSASEGTSEFCKLLKSFLEQRLRVQTCYIVRHLDLAHQDLDDTICISVCELERAVLRDISKEEFENIRRMLCVCKGMLWITGDAVKCPELAIITGLTRTVRWERDLDEANLVTLSISDPRPPVATLAEKIAQLFKQQFSSVLAADKQNGEFILKDGTFLTSRLVEAEAANAYLGAHFSRSTPNMTPMKDARRPIKLATSAPGLLDKLEWTTDEVYNQPLSDTHVEIDIKAVAMNFRDLMIAMGEHMAYSMGNEAAGTVARVGSQVTDVKVGDRVVYLCGIESTGCFHTFGRVDQNVVVRIPDHMSYEVACSLPCVYATVIYGLVDAGHLKKGEKILIHAAAGGVGQAAIHYANYVGAEIFATVSSPEKREAIMKLSVREDHIFSSRDLTFVKGILRATDNTGVDLILNSLSGEALRRSWDLLAPFGRFVEVGKKDAQNNGKIELRPFLRNVTMTSVELPTMMRHRPSLIKRLTEDTIRLWTEGSIKEADPLNIMSFSQVEEGLRHMQSGKSIGKMVFVPTPDDIIPIVPARAPSHQLRQDATYLLSGGLGGIGRSFAKWMVDHGARYLLFLSRSGNITPPVTEMLQDLKRGKCHVKIFRCDVSDQEQLKAVLEESSRTLPPIRGVVQGAMKLKDTMFENMSYEELRLAIKPKVHGSWNLHQLLPRDLDFFVMLSSATGILGNRAQANYAAGNTYQDQLAYHRRSLGLPASSIDLGQVLSIGYVAENRDRTMVAKHLATVLEVIREDEIHVLLEYMMDQRCSPPPQLVSGLTTALMYRDRRMPTPTYMDFPLFTHLRNMKLAQAVGRDANGGISVEALLNAASTLDEATDIVLTGVRTKLSALLAIPLENVDPAKSVSSNGVDSLVAMEFRAYLVKEMKADIPVLEIQDTLSITELSRRIANVSGAVELKE